MEKDSKGLEDLFNSKLYTVTDGHVKEMKKANQKYADAIYEIVEQSINSVKKFKSKEKISFKNKVMGDFVNTSNYEDVDHIGCSYFIMNESGIEIHLHYNCYTDKHKPSFSDDKFDLNLINELLKKYNIKVEDTCDEFGSNDKYIITFSKTKEKENEKPKEKRMTKAKTKGN